MDPCSFMRILVGNFAAKVSSSSKTGTNNGKFTCKIKFGDFPTQQYPIPLINQHAASSPNHPPEATTTTSLSNSLAACFTLDKTQVEELALSSKKRRSLVVEIYGCGGGGASCGWRGGEGKLVGRVSVELDLKKAESRPCFMHNGWVAIERRGSAAAAEVFFSVRAEPDPRYVFKFGGEPECSPQVFQVQGSARQAVFTCKFSLRCSGDRNLVSRPSLSEQTTSRNCLLPPGSEKEQSTKERKGWTVTIHDLSGSPVAMASMVTPFVPSPGSDHVSHSNPGAWLILRPSQGTWKPWGRLEAWRESPRHAHALGYRFELLHDTITASPTDVVLVNSTVDTKKGGKFIVDMTNGVATPTCSPHSSYDFGSGSGSGSWSGSESGTGWLSQFWHKGFVMSSTVEGNGKCGRPEVEIGFQHVNCIEDAAAFVALAAAMDLSMDACKLFSHKLRKELRHGFVV